MSMSPYVSFGQELVSLSLRLKAGSFDKVKEAIEVEVVVSFRLARWGGS
jgi:hypothetical protein